MTEYDPYKILWDGYVCGSVFTYYEKLKKDYDIARLKLEIFSREFLRR